LCVSEFNDGQLSKSTSGQILECAHV
jgi:hypothetical protein